ncbi:hypothetical protein M422DRAFT_261056 [Sphaerobolus stellatus SS14]|uniref:Uncharacterized protein n=1 Tax=Sphaerobolus stellatus (strain SS14) TaxID=990650 RepID=A0A0C9VFY4_SPHS4|nr:hypothetical protein M422DRAFT_261056 [Sphaerobolus stellatus SS14]
MSLSSSWSASLDSQGCSSQELQILPDQPVTLRTPPLADHIQLVLYNDHSIEHDFYLEIPIWVMTQHFLKPFKYLKYIGWAILGAEGVIKDDNLDEVFIHHDTFPTIQQYPQFQSLCYIKVTGADPHWSAALRDHEEEEEETKRKDEGFD